MEGPNPLYEKSRQRMQTYTCDDECKKEINSMFSLKEYFNGSPMYSGFNLFFVLTLLILAILLQLVVGKYIWNEVIAKLIPGVKKMNSLVQMLALIVFVQIVGYCCY